MNGDPTRPPSDESLREPTPTTPSSSFIGSISRSPKRSFEKDFGFHVNPSSSYAAAMSSPVIPHEQFRNSDTPKSSPRLLIHPTPSYLLLLDEMDKNDTESSPSTDSINLDDLPPPQISRFNQLGRLPLNYVEDYPYHRPLSRNVYTDNPVIHHRPTHSDGSSGTSSNRQNYNFGTPILGRAITNLTTPRRAQIPPSPVGTPRFRISMSPPKINSTVCSRLI